VGATVTAREEMLARIRTALGTSEADTIEVPREYRRSSTMDRSAMLDLLVERLLDYKARVRRCGDTEASSTIATALAEQQARRVVVPAGLAGEWLADLAGVDVVVDDGLSSDALDAVDGVITASSTAIAETGTVVLDASPDQGRRAITLVPDYHLCVVRAADVVATVPEALARLNPTRPSTWISGPSATSDIELNRVEGVHGPRTLEIVLIED
jgi:L-lactate dehydrogenase complex protein LldG